MIKPSIFNKGPKEITMFFLGLLTSLVLFFGGGIFIARLFVSGVMGIILGILLGIGGMFISSFVFGAFYLSKINKKK